MGMQNLERNGDFGMRNGREQPLTRGVRRLRRPETTQDSPRKRAQRFSAFQILYLQRNDFRFFLAVNGLLANFDKSLFFVESQGTGIGRVNVNFADQPRNAACNRLGPQVSIKPGCQMMPLEVFGYNDAIDVNKVFVTGL